MLNWEGLVAGSVRQLRPKPQHPTELELLDILPMVPFIGLQQRVPMKCMD